MKRTIILISMILIAVFAFAGGDGEKAGANAGATALEGYSRVTDDSLKFDLQWKIDGENLMVQMSAETTGWVAVGFGATNKMANANILIGYVADGVAYLEDDFGSGPVKHESDTALGGTEDFSDLEGEEANGVTTLRFTIPLDSGDSKDRAISPGETMKVIHASGPNGKDDFGSYHTKNRGTFEITF